jgi:hypothetical protein
MALLPCDCKQQLLEFFASHDLVRFKEALMLKVAFSDQHRIGFGTFG